MAYFIILWRKPVFGCLREAYTKRDRQEGRDGGVVGGLGVALPEVSSNKLLLFFFHIS